MKVLVDTNVYLNLFLKREGCEATKSFFNWCIKNKIQTYVTSLSMRDMKKWQGTFSTMCITVLQRY